MYDAWVMCDGVADRAARFYAAKWPQQRHPDRRTIARVNRNLDTHGAVKAPRSIRKMRPVRDDIEKREDVVLCTQNDQRVGTRAMSEMTGISSSSVKRILKEEGFKPYHAHLVQELRPNDDVRRLGFLAWLDTALYADPAILERILWTDESNFSNNGLLNRHNSVDWADKNPHRKFIKGHQTIISTNVWCGIVGEWLIGPYFFQGTLTGQRYLEFLKDILPTLLQNIPLNTRRDLILQQDGAPCHNARLVADYLNLHYPIWIGTQGPVNWPPRSPDLTPLDFFLWGHLKNLVYDHHNPPRTLQELEGRITAACSQITPGMIRNAVENIKKRAAFCVQQNGGHIGHLM